MNGELIPLRLRPGEDLVDALRDLARARALDAAFVLSAVGSLACAAIRFADAPAATLLPGPFEIIALSGSLSRHGLHLHAAVSDPTGRVIGGHLKSGCRIHTTAEILLTTVPGAVFAREFDPDTGYPELRIR